MRFVFSIFLIITAGWAAAQSYPEPSDLAVNDFAGIIGDEAEARLTEELDTLREDTGVELVVVTLSRQEMFAPDLSLKDFARGIFDEWGVGNKDRDDGILVLVLREDQAIRITLGKGFDRTADKASDAAVEKSFLPEFREERYEAGIERGVGDLIENLVTPYAAALETETADDAEEAGTASTDTASEATSGTEQGTSPETLAQSTGGDTAGGEEKSSNSILLYILGGIAALIGFFVYKSKTRKCPNCGAKGSLKTTTNTLVTPTETSTGKGERITTCEKCDYRDEDTYEISKREKSKPKEEPPEEFSGGEAGKKGSTGKW